MERFAGRALAFVTGLAPAILALAVTLSAAGIVTMHTYGLDATNFASRQLLWLAIAVAVYVVAAYTDFRFLRRTSVVVWLYIVAAALLAVLLVAVHPVMGARAWFSLGPVSFQPSDFAKFVIIVFMAKYFSRRHVEIADYRHIIVSGAYVGALTLLILVEPDFGMAVIIGMLWFGLILVSGIRKRQVALVIGLAVLLFAGLWTFGFKEYQRERILTFLNPASDVYGAGYNAYQSVIAAGSGELFGKGIGYGTQSKLRFLPEYQTDFIFASFAEEWGFVGVALILLLYGLLLAKLLSLARHAATNFETYFTLGVALLFLSHIIIHVGINLGLLPVTGTTIPFMSAGGSHLVAEFFELGVVASFARHARSAPRTTAAQEYVG
ncbi:MAG: rod shape-determining protein RodA [Patescibacteria group bacterium]|nr:rod shape-determining protein RodA [Patescibacteria group bacterium]MDE1966124.1 rod shape-determining protein RodA [Patescibacteria group bacterium]